MREVFAKYREAFSAAWSVRHDNPVSARKRAEADFLPAMLEIQETPPHPLARTTMRVILALFVIAVVWMIVGKIDIVAAAPGKILPDSRIKVAQAAQGGVVQEILVKDGDLVSAGDVLVELDSTATDADETSIANALGIARLEAAAARLLAEEVEFAAPPSLEIGADVAAADDVALRQQAMENLFYEQKSRAQQIRDEISALEKDLRIEEQGEKDAGRMLEQEKDLSRLRLEGERRQLEKLRELLPIAKDEYDTYFELHEERVVSRIQMQQAREKHISIKKDAEHKENQLEEIAMSSEARQTELGQQARQYQNRAKSLRAKIVGKRQSLLVEQNRFRREMSERRTQALQKAQELEQSLIKARQSERHHRIVAPADGVVQQLAIHTRGAVVQAAQALLVIVPKERVLEVEAFVENKDIGFVHVGQETEIKVDAFPYTKYGLLQGKVSRLSADAIEDEKRGLVYQARIQLDEGFLTVDGERRDLAPGMSVMAEIKTGERRVIEFFLAPLLRHGGDSLNER